MISAGESAVTFTAFSQNIDVGVGGVVNAIAATVFAFAFCWRLDQIRRAGWGGSSRSR